MRYRADLRKSIPFLLTLLVSVLLPPASLSQRAGRGAGEAATLAGRMRAFLEALGGDTPAAFFPRRGDWTWVQTHHYEGGADRVGVWRFRASETAQALASCGPVEESFL